MANVFDEETGPQSFSQILQPQGAPAAAPQMPEGGMAEVMSPQGPGIFERGKAWAEANPMPAQMLLHTFMRMAQGGGANLADTIGQGVSHGAQAGLMHLAQGKQEQQQQQETARKQGNVEADRKLQERGVAIREGQFGLEKQQAPVDQAFKQAQTKKINTETGIAEQQAPLQLKAIEAKIMQVQQAIEGDRDGLKTNQLRRQLMGLQIAKQAFEHDLDQTYGAAERDVKLRTSQFGAEAASTTTERALMETEDLKTLTPEARLNRGSKGKAGKTEQEQFIDFATRNADLFTDTDGKFDANGAQEAWQRLRNPNHDAEKAASEKTQIEAALQKVKVGEIVQAPNGKYYRRLK